MRARELLLPGRHEKEGAVAAPFLFLRKDESRRHPDVWKARTAVLNQVEKLPYHRPLAGRLHCGTSRITRDRTGDTARRDPVAVPRNPRRLGAHSSRNRPTASPRFLWP